MKSWGGEILVDGRGLFWVVHSNPDNDPLLPQFSDGVYLQSLRCMIIDHVGGDG